MIRIRDTVILAAVLSFVGVLSVLAQDYSVDWYTIDGGGEMATAGGNFELSGTIGQPDARNHPQPMTGGGYKLTGGFWVIPECPAIPADYDGDCDVDQADYQIFEACASGPGVFYAGDCDDRDLDLDSDVDQADFTIFQRCISGENVPANPNCAN